MSFLPYDELLIDRVEFGCLLVRAVLKKIVNNKIELTSPWIKVCVNVKKITGLSMVKRQLYGCTVSVF